MRVGIPRLRVDYRASLSMIGTVLKLLAVPLLIPVVVGVIYGDSLVPFFVTIAVTLVLGESLERLSPDADMGNREAFLMVPLTWIAVVVIGAIPYVVEAHGIPPVYPAPYPESSLGDPVDAVFESMSGFTTTGATVMESISFESHSRALMMWRQETQWLGGMGIVVLAVAILPRLSVAGAQLMEAEAPGPGIERLTPRIKETAKTLWKIYLGLTALQVGLLYLFYRLGHAPEMTLYNAVAHGFTTLPTGGFSPEARSIEAFSPLVQWSIVPFMLAAGTNFALFWYLLNLDFGDFFGDEEFRSYIGVTAVLSLMGAALIFFDPGLESVDGIGRIAGEVEPALRHSVFQFTSIVTTTGYASMDFNAWGFGSTVLLFIALFVGGSTGSTGGAIKIMRWVVVVKSIKRELFTTVHPEAVRPVRLSGNPLDERAIRGVLVFVTTYLVLFFVGVFLVAVDASNAGVDISLLEAASAVAATLGNVGPGFGAVGPMNNYAFFSDTTKLFMVVLMWAGRLEIIPVLVVLTPSYWTS
ncbi:TrkH family potassium uptake protein [Halorutilales archaeon Cl-col2-1]